ncbi:MAG: Hsp70 family protein [Oscillospiraceae bacterium]|nr:Hsp70 family protein [Oscillospiraceae bacterium]
MSTSKCVGIDLGTTNSVIAMVADDNSNIVCRTDKAGRKTFPSVIVYDRKSGGIKAGQIAFNRRGTVPEPIVSVKSHMGDPNYRVSTGPLTLSPIEVSAEVLKEMKAQMEDYLHGFPEYEDYVVDRAVITIPAYFASNARENTTKAGELAGLKVEFTLQEPTAAALYYCKKNDIDNGIFMVYDLGGGTFDVSIVRLSEGDAFVLGIAGNNYLGGDNFDDALARHLLEELQNSDEGYDLEDMDINRDEDDRRRFTRLKLSAEVIKKALSSQEEYFESTDGIFEDKSGAKVNLAATVSRDEFEALIRPLIESTLEECQKALREAEEQHGVTLDMIDGVLLVGGSTHIPLVGRIIEEHFTSPSLPLHTKLPKPLIDEPDMAVGYGAAYAAAALGVSSGGSIETKPGKTISLTASFQPGVGYGGISQVEGCLQAEGGPLPDGIYAKVTRAAGGCSKEFMVNEDGSFLFEDLVSEEEKEPYSCEFISGGKTILQANFDAAVGGNTSVPPVVLSRNYYIETVSEYSGELKKVKLMAKGTPLPYSADFTFSVSEDNPYAVYLSFFEEKSLLKQIVMNFDRPLPPGTEIRLSIACDRSSRFQVEAEAGGTRLSAELESSPPPKLPTRDEVDDAVGAARERIAQIPEPAKRVVAEKQLNRLAATLQEAVEAGDAVKAQETLEKAKGSATDGVTVTNPLHPPKNEFDAMVRKLEQMNSESEKGGPEVAKEIRAAANAGARAYENEDQAALSNAWNALQETEEFLKEDHGTQERPPMWLACTFFAQQCLELIGKYQSSDKVPPAARRDIDPWVPKIQQSCREIMQACRFMPSDEECMPHLQVIRELYPIAEKAAKAVGVTPPKGP